MKNILFRAFVVMVFVLGVASCFAIKVLDWDYTDYSKNFKCSHCQQIVDARDEAFFNLQICSSVSLNIFCGTCISCVSRCVSPCVSAHFTTTIRDRQESIGFRLRHIDVDMTALVPRAVRQAVGVTFPVPQPLDDCRSGYPKSLGYFRVVGIRMLAGVGAD